jgi:hypothetical protein
VVKGLPTPLTCIPDKTPVVEAIVIRVEPAVDVPVIITGGGANTNWAR